jgi:hypothetical protein
MDEVGNAYNVFILKPEGKRPLGSSRWKVNIEIDLKEIWWYVVAWFHMTQVRGQWRVLANMKMNFLVP